MHVVVECVRTQNRSLMDPLVMLPGEQDQSGYELVDPFVSDDCGEGLAKPLPPNGINLVGGDCSSTLQDTDHRLCFGVVLVRRSAVVGARRERIWVQLAEQPEDADVQPLPGLFFRIHHAHLPYGWSGQRVR